MPVVGFFPGGAPKLKTASGSIVVPRLSSAPITITVEFFPVACAFQTGISGEAVQISGMVFASDEGHTLRYAKGAQGGYSAPNSIAINPDAKTVTLTPYSGSAAETWNYWISGF